MYRHYITTLLMLLTATVLFGQGWEQAKRKKSATLDAYWFTSKPFIYEDMEGNLSGVEYDIIEAFADYVRQEEGIQLDINWRKADNFSHVLDIVRTKSTPNIIGVSAISVTEQRKRYARFSDIYLPDVTVLVSSKGTRIVRSYAEFDEMLEGMEGVTIKDTKYESLLLDIKEQLQIDFDITYITSEDNVLDWVGAEENRFGFIDLPVYLMLVKNGGEVVRQNLFTVRGEGYSFLFPLNSDWDIPLNAFLGNPSYQKKVNNIIASHLGEELFQSIESIYTSEQIGTSILTQEKELQLALIQNANLELEKEQSIRRILLIAISMAGVFLLLIGYLLYKNRKNTKILIGQRDQIYAHQEDIRQKNEQLINRNAQLIAMNEEKNNLVKILAHDIRSPLSQIIMVAEILKNPSDEAKMQEKELLDQVGLSANRINEMVSKILDMESLEQNQMKVMHERVDANAVINDLKRRYEEQASQKKITLNTVTCSENSIIRTDHLLLTLALENLVSNAIKFTPPNSNVILEAECKYDGVLFKVSDEGPGFTEEDKKLLFNRFQKLSAKPTGGESSIGLGLSIVKKYVTDIGGEVWLESEEGKGSTFYVQLSV